MWIFETCLCSLELASIAPRTAECVGRHFWGVCFDLIGNPFPASVSENVRARLALAVCHTHTASTCTITSSIHCQQRLTHIPPREPPPLAPQPRPPHQRPQPLGAMASLADQMSKPVGEAPRGVLMRHPSDDGTEIVEDGAEERFAKVGVWLFISSWCRGGSPGSFTWALAHSRTRPSLRGDAHHTHTAPHAPLAMTTPQ